MDKDIRMWQIFLLCWCWAHGWHCLMLWVNTGSLDAESVSVGMHFHCYRCQDEVSLPLPTSTPFSLVSTASDICYTIRFQTR